MAYFQSVVFNFDSEVYGIDINYVNGIEHEQEIVRVPNASKNIKGIINLRGEIIPVVNLRAKFNMANQTEPEETELIIVNLEDGKMALEVDVVDEIHNIDADSIVEMPIIAKGEGIEYFEKVAKVGDRIIIMINPFRLLTNEESEAAKQLADCTSEK